MYEAEMKKKYLFIYAYKCMVTQYNFKFRSVSLLFLSDSFLGW